MARSRVRRTAKVKRSKERMAKIRERAERRKRINEMEGWYKELEGYENQAIANLIDRAAVEETDEAVSQSGGEHSEERGGQGGSDGDRDS